MALARILVDGYSLLHGWPELAPGKPRHSEAARDELIEVLTRYRDVIETPITIVFDGGAAAYRPRQARSNPEMEVLFSPPGKTADQVIERVAYRLAALGEVLVVTDDYAERDTVINGGGLASSCANFILTVEAALDTLRRHLRRFNVRARQGFHARRAS
ncbi:MAG: NYN domain-containing protein [Verrucomicrobia bacterium]|nr:NYN domain-containing protein [Verrucomicrobiota bacterium]